MSAAVIGVLAAGWAITNLVRHRPFFARPTVVGAPELATFLIGPSVPSAIVAQWGDVAKSMVEGIIILAIIYVTTSYAVLSLIRWAARRSLTQISAVVGLVARALPLLLVFTAVIFLAPEIWQVAGTSVGIVYIFAVFSQALQITLVSVLLSAVYIVFGLLAISEAITTSWTTAPDVHVLLTFHLDDRTLVITEPLLRVAGFLSAFTGMYFTVVLSTDATYKEEFAQDVEPQIRQALAVRAAYLWDRSRGETATTQD